ncbi:hypothetical protein ATCC90586_002462 [Pythium insidiosum]|nr:hypothetical protein ATCC90586_002462 [Pythium insidiosum]
MKKETRVDNSKYGLPTDARVWCTLHPVLLHKLTKLRDERTDSNVFRHVLREVTFYLGWMLCLICCQMLSCITLHSLLPVQYYNKLPKQCNQRVAIVLEPVIATAGTIIATIAILKTWGIEQIKVISTIASKQGLQDLCSKHPDVEVYLAAIDDALTEDGYVFPGLGDAGDRQFQTGIHAEGPNKKQKI